MGENNTIALLSSINGYLKTIVDQTKTNADPKAKAETTQQQLTSDLHKGNVTPNANTSKKEKNMLEGKQVPTTIMLSMSTLPLTIKDIANIKDKDLKAFDKVITSVCEILEKFSNKVALEEAKNMVDVIEAVSKLQNIGLTKLAASMKMARVLGLNTSLNKIIGGIVKATKTAGKLNKKDIKNLKSVAEAVNSMNVLAKSTAILMMTVVGLAIAVKTIGTKDISISLGLVFGTLTALATMSIIIAKVAKSSKHSIHNLSKIVGLIYAMQGLVVTTLLLGKLVTNSFDDILTGFTYTTGIILGYAAIAVLVGYINKLVQPAKTEITNILLLGIAGMGLVLGTLLIGTIAKEAWPEILIGFGTIAGVMLGYLGLTVLAQVISSHISKTAFVSFKVMVMMAGMSMGLVLGSLLIGAIAQEAWDDILIGFGTIAAIMTGLEGLSWLASKISRGVAKYKSSFIVLVGLAGAAAALVLASVAIPYIAKKAGVTWYEITGSLIAVGGIMYYLAWIAKESSTIPSKGVTAAINKMKTLMLLLGACELLIAGAIGLAKWVTVDDIGWVAGIIGAIILIPRGLVTLSNYINKHQKELTTGAKSMLLVAGVALAAEAIIGGAIFLAKQIDSWETFGKALGVLAFAGTMVFGLAKLVQAVNEKKAVFVKGAKSMLLVAGVALAVEAIIGGAIFLAKMFDKDPNLIGKTALVLVAVSGIVMGLVGVLRLIEKHNKDLTNGAKSMLLVAGVALAAEALLLGVIGILVVKDKANVSWLHIWEAIGAMTTIVGLFGGLAFAAGKLDKSIKKGVQSMKSIVLFAAASELMLAGVVGILILKNKNNIKWPHIWEAIGAMTTIVGLFGTLAFVAGKFKAQFVGGLPAIGVITLFAAGAELLLGGIIALMILKNKNNVEWPDIWQSIGAMATIVTAFGVLGAAAGAVAPIIIAGLPSIGVITLFAAAAGLLLGGIILLMSKKNELNVSWDDIYTSVDAMTTIVTYFGILGSAAAVATIPVLLGLPAMVSITALATAGELLLDKLITIMGKKNKLGVSWNDVDTSLTKMTDIVNGFADLAKAAAWNVVSLKSGSAGLNAVCAVADSATAVLDKLVLVTAKVNLLGENGIKQIDETMGLLSRLISNSNEAFPGFSEICEKASDHFISLKLGSNALNQVAVTAVIITKSLEIISAATEKVKNISAQDIISSIQTFDTFTDALYDMTGLSFNTKALVISRSKSYITAIAETAIHMTSCLAKIADCSRDHFIRSASITKDGRIIYGEWTDPEASVKTITESFVYFVNTMSSTFKDLDKKAMENMENGVKVIGKIMEPISTFATTMSSFLDAGEGKIRVIKYDDNGKLVDTPAIDVAQVAGVIGKAVSIFCSTLFSDDNKSIWENAVYGGEFVKTSTGEDVYNPGNAERAMGILSTVLTPIGNFASTLSMFENGEDNELLIPIYDKDGNLKGARKVDVSKVANKIANAVQTFISTLAAQSTSWLNIYKSHNYTTVTKTSKGSNWFSSSEETETTSGNSLAEGLGVFASVMSPIISFTNLLKIFQDGDNDTLKVISSDGKIISTIKPSQIAKTIATTVTTFVSTLANGLTSNSAQLKSLNDNQSLITDLVAKMTESMTSFGNIDAANTEQFYTVFTDIMKYVLSLADDDTKTKLETMKTMIADQGKAMQDLCLNISSFNKADLSGLQNIQKTLGDLHDIIKATADTSIYTSATNNIGILNDYVKSMNTEVSDNLTSTIISLEKFNLYVKDLSNADNAKIFIDSSANFGVFVESLNNTTSSIKQFETFNLPGNNPIITMLSDINAMIEQNSILTDRVGSSYTNIVSIMQSSVPFIKASLSDVRITFANEMLDKKTGIITLNDKAATAIRKNTLEVKSFDETLKAGHQQRVKNLKAISTEINNITKAAEGAKDTLDKVKETFVALAQVISYANDGQLNRAVEALNSMSIHVGTSGGYGGSGTSENVYNGPSASDIGDAVKNAVDSLRLELSSVAITKTEESSGEKYKISGGIDIVSAL